MLLNWASKGCMNNLKQTHICESLQKGHQDYVVIKVSSPLIFLTKKNDSICLQCKICGAPDINYRWKSSTSMLNKAL